MLDLIIKSGQCYINGKLEDKDIAVKDGIISKIGKVSEETKEVYDAKSQIVLPGCIDTPMLRRETAGGAGKPFDETMLENLPKEGAYRLMPASAIAEAACPRIKTAAPFIFMSLPRLPTQTNLRVLTLVLRERKLSLFCSDRNPQKGKACKRGYFCRGLPRLVDRRFEA